MRDIVLKHVTILNEENIVRGEPRFFDEQIARRCMNSYAEFKTRLRKYQPINRCKYLVPSSAWTKKCVFRCYV